MNTIFTLTLVRPHRMEEDRNTTFTLTLVRPRMKTRCIGWYRTFEEANSAVFNNAEIVREDGFWKNCVVEEIVGGAVHPCPPKNEYWYSLRDELPKRIKKPRIYEKTVNFGIG